MGRTWHADQVAARNGLPHPNALPGATDAPHRATFIAIVGALGLLVVETVGEHFLGIAHEQSRMTWLFALYSVAAAPIIEETIFRGYLVVAHRGRVALWSGAVAASLVFAAMHPFLWRWDDNGFELCWDVKGWFSTGVLFSFSLWLYVARLAPWNPSRSLLPCFAAHAAKNIGVVAIKAAGGFMGPWW